jgi:DNA-3-methyladenine glycosylase
MKSLDASFFDRPAAKAALDLIGCMLVIRRGRKTERLMITETEAYEGFDDKASHASRGKTKRNEILFRSAGHIYVYFTYGMHWMLNIVCGKKDYPAAVLIRGAVNLETDEWVNGPARLTKRLKINSTLNDKKLGRASGLWIEKPTKKIPARLVKRLPRVGVDYAGPVWANKKWRFSLRRSG